MIIYTYNIKPNRKVLVLTQETSAECYQLEILFNKLVEEKICCEKTETSIVIDIKT